MREGKPSFTAACVAAARGLAGVDPLASTLVEGTLGALMRAGQRSPFGVAALNLAMLGLVDHLEMRTLAIDEAVRAGVRVGLEQLVVLGAGLDARAFRMRELEGVRVFEVDHPSTQAYKRARIETRLPTAREVRFVAVDFERDALGDALAKAGHEASVPTLWLWEGVTQYLEPEAMRATLRGVAARSAQGSRLLVSYGTPTASPLGAGFVRLAIVGFRVVGESIKGMYTPEGMRGELAAEGFRVFEDTSAAQWGERFGAGRRLLLLVDEHLAVATLEKPKK
jgi:methyltransferase (TIGR00027 family)